MSAEINREIGKLGKPRYLVLGHDLGVASDGYALIDLANEEILEAGSRLFDQPIKPKTGESLAVVRRGYRGTRRNLDRTQARLSHVIKLLKRYGIVPEGSDASWLQVRKGEPNVLDLRVKALDALLTRRELSQVLYSLAKRRGYIPHGDSDTSEGKVIKKALDKNSQLIASGGYRTVGEWLAHQPRSRNRSGDYSLCVCHEQIIDEVEKIFAAQNALGNKDLPEVLKNAYLDLLSWEKDTSEQDARVYKKQVGMCTYFSSEKRAARSCLDNELVSAWAAFDNITILDEAGNEHCLTYDQKQQCIDELFSPAAGKAEIKYSKLKMQFKIPSNWHFKGIKDDEEGRREPFEPKGWRTLRSSLAKDRPELLKKLRGDIGLADSVFEALAYASSRESLEEQISRLDDLSEDDRDSLVRLPYQSPALNGYAQRSHKALGILLGALEEPEITSLTQAEQVTGLDQFKQVRNIGLADTRLMPYESYLKATGKTCSNPTVLRAVSQCRKITNRIISKWGVPNEIHVELARDLRLGKKKRAEIEKEQANNRKENERLKKQLVDEYGVSEENIKGWMITKLKLYEEQGCIDLYTDDEICVDKMLSDERYCEVDHILPESRTGDNSRTNKLLVLATSNQNKKERTPYEWMHSGEANAPSWEAFRLRVEGSSKIWGKKKANLLREELDSDGTGFIQRNIVDTSYMTAEVRDYMDACLCLPDSGKVKVIATKGQATAWLRHAWGLNFGENGEKGRDDDRHHAIDALVIASCSVSLVQKTAKIHSRQPGLDKEQRAEQLRDCTPWPSFADEVRAMRETIPVERFVPRKGTGSTHMESLYRLEEIRPDGKARAVKENKTATFGNYEILEDEKTIRPLGDQVCLRLWLDSAANRGKGRWYADPIYVADIPRIKDGTYVPRIAKQKVGRSKWAVIPKEIVENTKPVCIYLGDTVRVGDRIGIYNGFNISACSWDMRPIDGKEGFPAIVTGLNNSLRPQVVR